MADDESGKTAYGDRKFHTSASAIQSGDWIALQKKTFTKWCNFYLKTRKESIEDLYEDFRSGVKLIHLLEVIGKDGMPRRYLENPKMEIHAKENLKTAFDYLRGKGVNLSLISGDDICSGNQKLTLGLVWTVISQFEVDDIVLDGVSGKEGLLLWCKRQTMGYAGVELKDFSRSWTNGLAFCAMMHRYRPDAFDFDSLDPANRMENVELALSTAEKYFDIDRLFDPEDIVEVERPDEKVIITYISIVFKGLAKFTKAEGLVKSVKKAVDITKRHDGWITQYVSQAQELKSLITQTADAYSTTEYGNSTANVKAALDAFYEYKRDTKPQYQAIQASLQGLFATLTASAKNNNRPQYHPPTGYDLPSLADNWAALESAEDVYEAGARAEHALFSSLDNIIARFDVKVTTCKAWLEARQETFASGHYGNSRTEVETLLEAHTAYEEQLAYYSQAVETLTAWSAQDGMEKHEEQPRLASQIAELQELFAAVQEAGTSYLTELHVSKEKHHNLALILKVETWYEGQNARFTSGEHGDSVVAAEDLLRVFDEQYLPAFARQRTQLAIDTDHPEVVARIEEVQGKFTALEATAAEYKAAVELSREKHKQLFVVTKVEAWMEKQIEMFVSGEYGENWDATKHLMEDFEEVYKTELAENKSALGMEPVTEEVSTRVAEASARMDQAEETGEQYLAALAQTMENHKHLVELTKTYNSKATDLMFAAGDLEEECEQPALYQSVDEVKTAITTFESDLRQRMSGLTELYNEINGYAEQLQEAGAEEAFSRYTINALYERHEEVSNKLDARETALQESLASEQTKEDLRVQFASLAAAFKSYCDEKSALVTGLEGDLETQIAAIQGLRSEYATEASKLEEIQTVSDSLDEWGVVNNSHTSETILSLRAVWEVLGKTYVRTEEALQGQLLAERSGQITPEQYKEVKEVMVYFDEDKDEHLSVTEFHNAITGLGIVMTEQEIEDKMTELDSSGDRLLNFDEFASFMVSKLSEPGHTQDDVTQAFRDLADGSDFIFQEQIEAYFHDDEDKAYLAENMPPGEEGTLDYETFSANLFSR